MNSSASKVTHQTANVSRFEAIVLHYYILYIFRLHLFLFVYLLGLPRVNKIFLLHTWSETVYKTLI